MTGPFTVESLSPHRVLVDGPRATPRPPTSDADRSTPATSCTMILDNLRKAGVQNTMQGRAPRVRPPRPLSPATWIQAEGEYTDADGEHADASPSPSAPSTAPSARS